LEAAKHGYEMELVIPAGDGDFSVAAMQLIDEVFKTHDLSRQSHRDSYPSFFRRLDALTYFV
jgi:hypothetical protein